MAMFCMVFRISPSEYRSLTLVEYLAFIRAYTERGTTNDLEDLLNG
jgi:hypothetical protein